MSENVTSKITIENMTKASLLLSREVAEYIIWIIRYVICPCTSVIGICENVTTVVVLTRQGLKRSSNILLLVLAVSDVLFLIGLNNVPEYIMAENVPPSFRYSESVNHMCYVIYVILSILFITGYQCSLTIPVLIAGERLLAIFFPLHFRFILTPLRAWISTSVLFALSFGFTLYRVVVCQQYFNIVTKQVSIGGVMFSPFYYQRINGVWVYEIIRYIGNNLTGIVPIILVSLGCVVIGIQVKLVSMKRLKIVSSFSAQTSRIATSKTTKVLLSVCLLFIVCSGFAYLVTYIINLEALENEISLREVLSFTTYFFLVINSIGNFIIYVGVNKNFRESCRSLISCSNTGRGVSQKFKKTRQIVGK